MTHAEKQHQIIEAVTKTTQIFIRDVKAAYPKKRIFPKRGGYRAGRQKKSVGKIMMYLDLAMGAAQTMRILATPIRIRSKDPDSPIAYIKYEEIRPEIVQFPSNLSK